MITEDRKAEMYEMFLSETNEPDSEEWREDLTEEEIALVDAWDEAFEGEYLRLCKAILANQKEGAAL